MEELLNNGINVIPNILNMLKETISCFWQPSMETRGHYHNDFKEYKYRKPNKEIDNKRNLSLDTIMLLKIGDSETYMVTMLGSNNERIVLDNGQREKDVIEKCLQDNLGIERKPIANFMPSDYIELYNEALNTGKCDICLTMIKGTEAHINDLSKEKNEIMKTMKIAFK